MDFAQETKATASSNRVIWRRYTLPFFADAPPLQGLDSIATTPLRLWFTVAFFTFKNTYSPTQTMSTTYLST